MSRRRAINRWVVYTAGSFDTAVAGSCALQAVVGRACLGDISPRTSQQVVIAYWGISKLFGSADNARAFWNWEFIPGPAQDLPQTRAMLMRACDVRLPARLTEAECEAVATILLQAVAQVRPAVAA